MKKTAIIGLSIIITLLLTSIATADPQKTLTDGLINYWTLDDTLEDIISGYNLTNINSTAYATGKINNGTDFTEASENALKYTNFDNIPLEGTGTYTTICLWGKNDDSSDEMNDFISVGEGSGNDIGVWHRTYTGDTDFLRSRLCGANHDWNISHLDDDEYHHYCVIFDGDDIQNQTAYADGLELTETFVGGVEGTDCTVATGNLTIMHRESADDWEEGEIDEIGIWNRPLTRQEILWLYGKRQYPFTETYMKIPKLNSLMDIIPYGALTFYSSLDIHNSTGALAEVHTEIGSSGEFGTQTNNPTYASGYWGDEIQVPGVDETISWTGQTKFNQQVGTRCAWVDPLTYASEDVFGQSITQDNWKLTLASTPYYIFYFDSTAHYAYSDNEPTYDAMMCGTYESYTTTSTLNNWHTGFYNTAQNTTTDLTFAIGSDPLKFGDCDGADFNGEADNLMIWDIEMNQEELKRLASLFLANITPINTTGKQLIGKTYEECYIDQNSPGTDYCSSYILGMKNRITGDDRMYALWGFNITENLYPEAKYYVNFAMWSSTADAGENISLRYQDVELTSGGENWNEYVGGGKGNETTGTQIGRYEPTSYEIINGNAYEITTQLLSDSDGIFTILGHMEGNDDTDYFYAKSRNAVNGYGEGAVIKAENIPINFTIIGKGNGGGINNFVEYFNVSINGVNLGETTTGQYETNITDEGVYNITVNGNVREQTITNYRTDQDMFLTMTAKPSITMVDGWTGATINTFNATINGTVYETTTGIIFFNYNNTQNITLDVNGYLQQTITRNLSDDQSYQEYAYEHKTTLTAKEINTNNTINTWTLQTEAGEYSTTNGSVTIYPTVGVHAFNWTKTSNYFNITGISYNATGTVLEETISDLYARNITFKDDISTETIYPTCVQDGYTYTTPYLMHKSNSDIICTLFGYTQLNFSNSNYPDSSYYNMTPVALSLTFSEVVQGVIQAGDTYIQEFNDSSIDLQQYNITEGYVKVTFNPDSGNYQQVFSYYNDLNTTISENILVQTVDLQQAIKVTGNKQALDGARVCAKYPYNGTYSTTYCDFTDNVGETIIQLDDQNTYLICAQAEGYEPDCELHYIPATNQETITIELVSTETKAGNNYIFSTCKGVYTQAESCELEVITYKPYYSICVNISKTVGAVTTSTLSCSYNTIGETFLYSLSTAYDYYNLTIQLDGEDEKTIFHYNGTDTATINVNYRQGNNSGLTIREKAQENLRVFIALHFIFVIIGVLSGMIIEKYFNGYGLYGSGIWFLFISLADFYVFYIPAGIIAYYFILEKVVPIFKN